MIRANELRLGNLIQHKYSGVIKADLNAISIVEIQNREDIEEIYSPIPLTKEWLLEFGFVNNELLDKHLIFIWYENHIGIKGMLGIAKPWSCIYVHQLQNLYFALTGEELEIK